MVHIDLDMATIDVQLKSINEPEKLLLHGRPVRHLRNAPVVRPPHTEFVTIHDADCACDSGVRGSNVHDQLVLGL